MVGYNREIHFCTENKKKCEEYVKALEVEREKIQVFRRELPLCLELVTQAIEACKQQLSGTTTAVDHYSQDESESDHEQTTSSKLCPILEEFIPINLNVSSADNEEQSQSQSQQSENESNKRSDWLKSVQLWNQTTDSPTTKQDSPRRGLVVEANADGSTSGAFHPFKKDKIRANNSTPTTTKSPPEAAASSSAEEIEGTKKDEKEGQRKTRRSWSTELHRRFLHALEQLGGSHVATPKQIKEIMKVDGLTNDEVKSHLQKFRLHERRPNPSMHNNNQAPQFVVVGGIWVPPMEYTNIATTQSVEEASRTSATTNRIYAPIAAPLPDKQRKHLSSDDKPMHSKDRANNSKSSTNSSTTHATTITQSF